MKVLFFSRLFYPHIGGVEKHVLELSKKLVKKGYSVTIVTEQYSKKLKLKEKIDNIDIYRIPNLKEGRSKKFQIWKWLWRNKKLIESSDIVHCHDVFFWYLPFRFIFINKSVFTTFHGFETKFPLRKAAILIRFISEKLSWGNICIGKYIEKWYGTKANYILYGAADKIKTNKIIENKLKIIFAGRMDKDIGVETYIKILDLLKKEKKKFLFRAYGDGNYRKKFEKYGKTYGFVKDLNSKINKGNIIFSSSYLTIINALSEKKLVVSVYENELKKDYLNMTPFSDFIISSNDAKYLKERIIEFNSDDTKMQNIIKDGYGWAKHQTWGGIVSVYERLWNEKR